MHQAALKGVLTLLHSERPKLHRVLAVLSAIGLDGNSEIRSAILPQKHVLSLQPPPTGVSNERSHCMFSFFIHLFSFLLAKYQIYLYQII